MPDLATASTLAVLNQDTAATVVEIGLSERQRRLDALAGAPENDDQGAQPRAARVIACGAHDGDDLLDRRRIGWVAHALVAWRSAHVKARHGRRRAATTGAIEQRLGHWSLPGHRGETEHPARTSASSPKQQRNRAGWPPQVLARVARSESAKARV
jgi:hypothetical protein